VEILAFEEGQALNRITIDAGGRPPWTGLQEGVVGMACELYCRKESATGYTELQLCPDDKVPTKVALGQREHEVQYCDMSHILVL